MPNDARNYARNAVPFANPQEANTALQAFLDGVRKLRDEHRMCDVGIAIAMNVEYPEQLDEDGKTASGVAMVHAHMGASHTAAPLMAFGYGEASAENRARMNRLLAGPNMPRGTAEKPRKE